jgi:hypothetical protein
VFAEDFQARLHEGHPQKEEPVDVENPIIGIKEVIEPMKC